VSKVVLEAIGSYARKLVCGLVEAGFSVFVVNPRRIKAFRDAEGLIAKTDRLDAALIARFAHKMSQDLRPLRSNELLLLKALSTRQRQLTELVAMEKTRLKQAADAVIVSSCKEMIAMLEEKCAAIEEELMRRIDNYALTARRRDILVSIPGVGKRISALVVVEIPELGAIDRKAAASLAGLAPHPSQSGLSKGRNAIAGGRPCLRSAFYMAALVAARTNPKFKQLYRDMRNAGKPAKVALVAIARRIVALANALLRDDLDGVDAPCSPASRCHMVVVVKSATVERRRPNANYYDRIRLGEKRVSSSWRGCRRHGRGSA
jgi:transposase